MTGPASARALAFVESIEGLDTAEEVLAAFRKATDAFGFSTVALGELPRPGSADLPAFFVSTWPASWIETYVGEGLAALDPTAEIARFGTVPVTWTEIRQRVGASRPRLRLYDACRASGWPEGLVVPIHGPRGYCGAVSLGGETLELSPADRAALHLMSLYLHERMHDLLAPKALRAAGELPALTRGEIACIEWLIAGKSDWEIGEILTISESTAHYRIERAKKKLGVKTRAQLTALAVLHGYVRP